MEDREAASRERAEVYEGVSRRARSWVVRLVGEIGVVVVVVEAAGEAGGVMVMVSWSEDSGARVDSGQ